MDKHTGMSFAQHKSILQWGLRQRMSEAGYSHYDEHFLVINAGVAGYLECRHSTMQRYSDSQRLVYVKQTVGCDDNGR